MAEEKCATNVAIGRKRKAQMKKATTLKTRVAFIEDVSLSSIVSTGEVEMAVAEDGPGADPSGCQQSGMGEPMLFMKKHPMNKYIGAHLSIQGGLWKSVTHAVQIGAHAFALFLRSQRTWSSKPLEEAVAERFRQSCMEHSFSPEYILPHSPYLMNLGSPRPDVYEKSRALLVEELERCHQLGLTLYNLHPGSRVGAMSVDECLDRIADSLNYAHGQVKGVITGHDLSQKAGLEDMLKEFSEVVGLHYLKALHINDSKGALGSHLDRHENIGRGHIGLEGFRNILNEPRFKGLPMILETPATEEGDEHAAEIKLLYSLCEERGKAQEEAKGEAT